jgi:hypothetical protein
MAGRPWTRLGIVGMAAHLGYELAAGVGVPLASRVGPLVAGGGYAGTLAVAYREAGQLRGSRGEAVFAALNGVFLAAVVNHYTLWPRDAERRIPWLVECEGLHGRVIGPYNVMLQGAVLCSLAGLLENRDGWSWGIGFAVGTFPFFRWATPREYDRLVTQAQRRPRWWNRRLSSSSVGW